MSDDDSGQNPGARAFLDGEDGPPRGRRRRTHFDEHMAATRLLVGYTDDDEARITASSALIEAHISAVAATVYAGLLAHPETAAQFSDATGAINREQVAMRQQAFGEWLHAAVSEPLDAATAEYLASIGHAHVRREQTSTRIKARYLVTTISRVHTLIVAILADSITDASELAACASAWHKRLIIHLDLLLAVYGSTESSAHWY